jgi:hypothetical protein
MKIEKDKKLAAVCGLFCPSCTLFIGSTEDPERLKWLANQFGASIKEVKCHGCRADIRSTYCETCKIAKCAVEKGIDFCGECDEFPCDDLKAFQAQMPHRIELWESHERIREVGWEQWFTEMVERYSCPKCGTINSAYDIACRGCGAVPSCEYVSLHKETIMEHLSKSKIENN